MGGIYGLQNICIIHNEINFLPLNYKNNSKIKVIFCFFKAIKKNLSRNPTFNNIRDGKSLFKVEPKYSSTAKKIIFSIFMTAVIYYFFHKIYPESK